VTRAIGPVKGSAMANVPILENSYLAIHNGLIEQYGSMSELPAAAKAKTELDATGRFVFPSFVDSHTHLIFAASREEEFVMKIKGATYEEIAASGGGNS
jgi:imidazolonepropionase